MIYCIGLWVVQFSKERGEEEVWGGEFGQFLIGAQLGFGRKKGDSLIFLWFIICTFVRLKHSWVHLQLITNEKKYIIYEDILPFPMHVIIISINNSTSWIDFYK